MTRKGVSYRTQLVAGICGLVLATGAVVIAISYQSNRATTTALVESLFREVSSHAVTHTQAFVLRAGPVVESLRGLADRGLALDDPDRLAPQLLAILQGHPGLTWVSYGDESGRFTGAHRTSTAALIVNRSHIVSGKTLLTEHEVRPDGSWRLFRQEPDSGYDPRTRPYYQKARRAGHLVWLPPYIFFHEPVPGVSCSAPVTDAAGRLRGVLSVDFDLKSLSDFVAGISVSEHSRFFLFTSDGALLAHPDLARRTEGETQPAERLLTLADTQDPLVKGFQANLPREHVHSASQGEPFRSFVFRHEGQEYIASATPFSVGDDQTWVVGALAPEADFLAGVWRSQSLVLLAAGGALLVGALLAVGLARSVSGPVMSLTAFTRKVGGGDLDVRPDFGGAREFRELAGALGRMIEDLRDRLRLRHSLDIAMEVQQRLLPRKPPQVPGLDITGHSTYCDETGGDYYDFLILDEAAPGKLLVAVGDVMGHGVAAALIMAGARAVLRDRAASAGSLAELMGRLNRLLAADLEGTRFMTMYVAVVDAPGRALRWISAGHDPAIVFDPAAQSFEETDRGDMPLGIMEDTVYTEHAYGPLRPGMVITIGTDGVWEMPNAAGEQFGKERLREAIQAAASGSAAQIVQAVLDRLRGFHGDLRPVDDVTFVVIKVHSDRAVTTAAPEQR